jgi:hypothetical protein
MFNNYSWGRTSFWLFLSFYFIGYLLLLIRNLHFWIKEYGVFDYENCGRDLPRDHEVVLITTHIITHSH